MRNHSLPFVTAPVCLVLCLALGLLAGCMAGQQRGVSGAAYVSTSRPAIMVQARDLELRTAGRGTGMLLNASMTGGLSPTVRTVVYGSTAKAPMAIIAHAELPNDWWIWTTVLPRVGAIHEGTELIDGVAFTAFTYLVPRRTDPYAGIVGDPVGAPEEGEPQAYWLARYFGVRTNFNRDKIILEYREPAPQGLVSLDTIPFGMTDSLAAFEDRARKAFSLSSPAEAREPVRDSYPEGVRWQYMRDAFLGDVMYQEPVSRFN